ncbi:hypothetical protein PFMALIP_06214 [Plasmodium falciparum MaliPS096_E11]|uniref:Uncharacterized protein n=1 Tax=Plasmodium falciparum MaliPS096_E11 TaxID=1036727 RepID=A0A024WGB0_PLAFA|nr:hypothetical protein PFMALIP_06214 [Plasmodium falciparum MaliPS096_E11]
MYNNEDDSVEENPGNLPSYEDDFLFNTTGKDHEEEVKGKEKKRGDNNNNNNKNYDNNYDYKYDDIYDIITNSIKESEMKNEMKISDININNDNTSTLVINYRKKKRTKLNDSSYYSLKLPKFIDVCLDIKKKKNNNINDAKVNEDDINKNNHIYLIYIYI